MQVLLGWAGLMRTSSSLGQLRGPACSADPGCFPPLHRPVPLSQLPEGPEVGGYLLQESPHPQSEHSTSGSGSSEDGPAHGCPKRRPCLVPQEDGVQHGHRTVTYWSLSCASLSSTDSIQACLPHPTWVPGPWMAGLSAGPHRLLRHMDSAPAPAPHQQPGRPLALSPSAVLTAGSREWRRQGPHLRECGEGAPTCALGRRAGTHFFSEPACHQGPAGFLDACTQWYFSQFLVPRCV